jgi:hypothetical protein
MSEMGKRKTSLNIDDELWQKWLVFVVQKTGTSRNTSSETAKALEEYMQNHSIEG